MSENSTSKRSKLINDPIHGYITLEQELLWIIDTPHFQRLRDLKQLGTCYYVFPGASHNRFEHSIGVAHIAGLMLHHLQSRQPELNITDRDIILVKAAGLCHDLGHGPFSHVFDNEVIPRARSDAAAVGWTHEQASVMMLKDLLQECRDRGRIIFNDEEEKTLFELIHPYDLEDEQKNLHPNKRFLYEVVANCRNSIDVDKFDYLARDCYNIGMKSSYDYRRLIKHCRVIDGQICFHKKEVFNIYELFHTRYSLFKQIYTHRVSKAFEYMVTDVLLLADPFLKISQAIFDPKAYLGLSDHILKTIEHSSEPQLAAARELLDRIRKRKLYRCCFEFIIPPDVELKCWPVTEKDVAQCSDGLLQPEDLWVNNLKINYAMKDSNPVDRVKFFNDWNDTTAHKIPASKVSLLTPAHFQERVLRVYLKKPTTELMKVGSAAAEKLLNAENISIEQQVMSRSQSLAMNLPPPTPAKPPKSGLEVGPSVVTSPAVTPFTSRRAIQLGAKAYAESALQERKSVGSPCPTPIKRQRVSFSDAQDTKQRLFSSVDSDAETDREDNIDEDATMSSKPAGDSNPTSNQAVDMAALLSSLPTEALVAELARRFPIHSGSK